MLIGPCSTMLNLEEQDWTRSLPQTTASDYGGHGNMACPFYHAWLTRYRLAR